MRKYKPATFQPTIRPDWGGVLSYLSEKEKSQILEAIIKYPSVECNSVFWQETIKPDLDLQFHEFKRQCEAKSRGIRERWGKTSITPVKNDNKTSITPVIVSEGIEEGEGEGEGESERIGVNESKDENKQERILFSSEKIEKINSVLEKYSLPQIKTLTDERKNKLKQRIKDAGSFDEFINQMEKALDESSFLRGDSGKWRADFDFFLQKSKWQKAIEGGYADKEEEIRWATSDWK